MFDQQNIVDLSKTIPVSFVTATTKDASALTRSIKDLCGEHADIIVIKNPDNLSEAYDEGWKKARHDIVVFVHDDVQLRFPKNWYPELKKLIDDKSTGFLGVAGTRGLLTTGKWFEFLGNPTHEHLLGSVTHGSVVDGKYEEHTNVYGDFGDAVVLDGCLLITTKRVLEDIGGFSKEIFGKFHFYDVATTLRAHMAGYRNFVINLPIVHMSGGNFSDDWAEARDKFVEKYRKDLPQVVDSLGSQLPADKLRLFSFRIGMDGCSYYRIKIPFDKIKKMKLAEVMYQDALSRLKIDDSNATEIIQGSDIIFLRGGHTGGMKRIQLNFDCRNKKFIYDTDDNDFEMSPYNDAYGAFTVEDFWHDLPDGGKTPVWIDKDDPKAEDIGKKWPGVRFYNQAENKIRKEDTIWTLQNVDAVTVTTEYLANVYRKYAKKVYVLPNAIDFDLWPRVPLNKDNKEIRIGWAGGASHFADLQLLRAPITKLLKKNKNCKFVVFGSGLGGWINDLPQNQVERVPWVASNAYSYRKICLNLDIALAPLRGVEFDRGKSPIKYLEAAAMGVPMLASNVTPYRETIEDGVTGYLFNTKGEFLDKIEKLISSAKHRKEIGEAAYQYCYKNYNAEKIAPKYVEVCKELLRR